MIQLSQSVRRKAAVNNMRKGGDVVLYSMGGGLIGGYLNYVKAVVVLGSIAVPVQRLTLTDEKMYIVQYCIRWSVVLQCTTR